VLVCMYVGIVVSTKQWISAGKIVTTTALYDHHHHYYYYYYY